MNVLITSGGTKVPIDPARDLTNMSSGTFGSKIATEFLARGHRVHYLIPKDGKTPFSQRIDLKHATNISEVLTSVGHLIQFAEMNRGRYYECNYRDYEDYARKLEEGVKAFQPDIVVLVAAVSDYLCDYSDNKIRSAKELTIQLRPALKLISQVKLWHPTTTLVGFKLLVEASDDDLIEAAQASIVRNGCDMVVANDLDTIKAGNHRIIIVRKGDDKKPFDNRVYGDGCDLAREVVDNALEVRKKCAATSS
jgi:phosphopantothenate-cysteine ligase